MSASDNAELTRLKAVLEYQPGQYVQEFGYDEDVDFQLRENIEDLIDADLEDEDSYESVDGVILWWRNSDGDLVDALMDCLKNLVAGGTIWVLTPKPGRAHHVNSVEIKEAAELAGLRVMNAASLAPDWAGTRLSSRS